MIACQDVITVQLIDQLMPTADPLLEKNSSFFQSISRPRFTKSPQSLLMCPRLISWSEGNMLIAGSPPKYIVYSCIFYSDFIQTVYSFLN